MAKLERIIAEKAQLGRPAVPADFGTGQGLENLGNALETSAAVTDQLFRAAEQAAIGKARSNLAVELNDFRIELKSRVDHVNDVKDFEEFKRKATEKHRSTIVTNAGRRQFDDDIFDVVERARVETIIGARNKAMAQIRIDTAETANDFKNLFIDSDDDSARKKHFDDGIAAINRAEAMGGLTPEKAELDRIAFHDEALAGLAFRMIQESQSPADAQEVVEQLINPEGPFKTMDSLARQKSIAAAKTRQVFEVDKIKTHLKWLQSQQTRALKIRKENGAMAMYREMLKDGGSLTTEYITTNINDLSPAMIVKGMASVAIGGGFKGPPFDPEEVMKVAKIEADDPATFRIMDLDPVKLGTLFESFINRQRIAASKVADIGPTPAKTLQVRIEALKLSGRDGARFHDLFWSKHTIWVNEHKGRQPGFSDTVTILNEIEEERDLPFWRDRTPDLNVEAERVRPGIDQTVVRNIVKMIEDSGGVASKQAVDNILADEAQKAEKRGQRNPTLQRAPLPPPPPPPPVEPRGPLRPRILPDIPPPPPPRPGGSGKF